MREYIIRKRWQESKLRAQHFVPNKYVSACGKLKDGTILYSANIQVVKAWKRTLAGIENCVGDDELSDPHDVYRGEFI